MHVAQPFGTYLIISLANVNKDHFKQHSMRSERELMTLYDSDRLT